MLCESKMHASAVFDEITCWLVVTFSPLDMTVADLAPEYYSNMYLSWHFSVLREDVCKGIS